MSILPSLFQRALDPQAANIEVEIPPAQRGEFATP